MKARKLLSMIALAGLWLASMASAETGGCLQLEQNFKQAKDIADGEKIAFYEDQLRLATANGCLFASARAHAGLARFSGIERSRLALALDQIDRSRAQLKAWRRQGETNEKPLQSEIDDLLLTQGLHELNALFRLGWLEEAEHQLESLQSLHEQVADVAADKRVSFGILGARTLRLAARIPEARQKLLDIEPMLELVEHGESSTWNHELGWIEFKQGRPDAARKRFEAALTFESNRSGQANIVLDLAHIALLSGRAEKALANVVEARRLAKGSEGLHLNAHLRYVHALILDRLGEHDEARRLADHALDLLDATRDHWADLGLAYLSKRQSYLKQRIDLALDSGDPLDLWKAVEHRRARLLLRELEARSRPSSKEETRPSPEVRLALKDLHHRLLESLWRLEEIDAYSAPDLRRQLEKQVLEVRGRLHHARARQALEAGRSTSSRELTPEEAAALLGEDSLGLLLVAGEEQQGLAVLDPSGRLEVQEELPAVDDVAELATRLTRLWRQPGRGAAAEAAASHLSSLLFKGLEQRLEEFSRLVVVASGPLEGFPLGALSHPETGRPLIASHEVVYLPSFSVLAAVREASCVQPSPSILALGDAIFGAGDPRWPDGLESSRGSHDEEFFSRLVESEQEVADIRRRFGSIATVLNGSLANRQRFVSEASRHRFLHLATHAKTDVEKPELSRLVLSCLDERGRRLEADRGAQAKIGDAGKKEIADLGLCRQTVVLSACSSAAGQRIVGEGVFGLPRAFLEVGASTVVATAWVIEDAAAAKLMGVFYGHLEKGQTVSYALSNARRKVAGAGAPMSDWAPFILIGDWQARLVPGDQD